LIGGIGETGEDGTARIATPDIIADLDEGSISGFVVLESQAHVVEAVIVTRGRVKASAFTSEVVIVLKLLSFVCGRFPIRTAARTGFTPPR